MTSLPLDLRIGVESIDREHFDLVMTLDRLMMDHGSASRAECLSETLNQLGEQLVRHFDSEEHFLRSCGMPQVDVDAHVHAHNLILDQYVQLSNVQMEGKTLSDAAQLVKELVLGHLLEHDVKIRRYVSGGPMGLFFPIIPSQKNCKKLFLGADGTLH